MDRTCLLYVMDQGRVSIITINIDYELFLLMHFERRRLEESLRGSLRRREKQAHKTK